MEDPRLKIPDEILYGNCDHCGDDIAKGSEIVKTQYGVVHEDCWLPFAWSMLEARWCTAGEDN